VRRQSVEGHSPDAGASQRATCRLMRDSLRWTLLSIESGFAMAVGIRIKLPGVTEEQFDHVHDQVNPDRTRPNGLLFHASGPIDGGWGIIDFWESRADFDAFAPQIMEGWRRRESSRRVHRTSRSSPCTR
jgi:hypothetical protein